MTGIPSGIRVAILGTGLMGSAAAKRLAGAGAALTLWNRTREKAEKLAREVGAKVASTPEAAVSDAEYALLFLLDDNAVLGVVSRIPRSDGLVLVNLSTITPTASRAARARLGSLGICYVEAPVIGGPRRLEEGEARLLIAGEDHCKSRSRIILNQLAGDLLDLGSVPNAMVVKLAYNSLHMTALAALGESLLLLESYGIDPKTLASASRKTPIGALVDSYIDRVMAREWPVGARLEVAAKDLEYMTEAAWSAGTPNPVSSAAGQLYRIGVSMGCGGIDYARTYTVLKGCRE